jgi:hypothetical protein
VVTHSFRWVIGTAGPVFPVGGVVDSSTTGGPIAQADGHASSITVRPAAAERITGRIID